MKRIIAPYILLCVVITCVSNFSFAQTDDTAYCTTQSSICGTAPEQFTFLMDFVREMTVAIKTIGPEWAYLGQYVNPNWFQWTVFTAPKKTVLGTVARNVANKLKFGVASTAIFSSPVNFAGIKDMLWWIVLLSKNQIFLRDNKLVEQLESQVNDKKYELGLWGWWYDQIIPENRAIMQAIIQKYIDKWLLIPSSKVNPGVSYNNVTSLLTHVLSSAKSFLYFGATTGFDAMTRWSSDQSIFIGFTTNAITTVQRDYNCARWSNNICSSELKKIKNGWSKMRKSLSLWSSDTKKTFKDAVTRLWQIFSPSTQDATYTARENDLLRSMYGSTQISKWTLADSLKKSWAGIKKSWAEVGQQVAGVVSDVTSFRTFPKDIKGTVQVIPTLPDSPPDTSATTDISKAIDSYVYDVFASQKIDLDLVGMSEVKDITPAFAVLGKQISVIKNDIIGNKDKQGSLISTLWASCELQCGGWWSCR